VTARRIASLGGPALALALVLAGCGGGGGKTTTTAPPTTTAPASRALDAYFFRNAALTRVPVRVPGTQAVATEALGALLAGPPAGYETALPQGVRLLELKIASGVAVARFSSELGRPGRSAQAQVVATLAQFPTVHGVELQEEGTPGALSLEDGAGHAITRPATAADYGDLTARAAIFVRAPARDSTVSSPVHASGTADVFEGAFEVDVWSGGRRLRTQPIQATSGTGTRGTWSATIALPPGPAKLVFFEPSAANGKPLHTTTVFLNVR
jgi:hypothetical protein